MSKVCVIYGAGEVFPAGKKIKADLVIAADGGYAKAVRDGYAPDVVIGDFDSSEAPTDTEAFVIKISRVKDDTDTLAAIKTGLRRGCDTFVVFGGVGGRLDHTVANFGALAYLNAFGAHGYLVDRDSVATVVTDEKFTIPNKAFGTVSVFAYGGDAEGVTLENLDYTLDKATLCPHVPIGVSNNRRAAENAKPAEISVEHGSLLIFFPRFVR